MTAPRRLGSPRPVIVGVGAKGPPSTVEGEPVECVLEDWLVEDRWWTERPIRRRYFELVLSGGRCIVAFRDLVNGQWFVQRG